MNIASTYIHSIDGRLRIKIPEVKYSPAVATEVESRLQEIEGVDQVKANPTTGNVLVLYDPVKLSRMRIFQALQGMGFLLKSVESQNGVTQGPSLSSTIGEKFGEKFTEALLSSMAELAVKGIIRALI